MSAPEQGGLSEAEREALREAAQHIPWARWDDAALREMYAAVEAILAARLAAVPAAEAELRAAVEALAGNETARLAMRNAMLAKLGDVGMDAALATAAAYVAQEALRSLLAGRGDV